jgi:predicted Fe-Mo cluster-binding NifX family protein
VKGKRDMKVLVPVSNQTDVFHNNLFKAPLFAEYTIDTYDDVDFYCSLKKTISNPCNSVEESTPCDTNGICDIESCSVAHLKEHYTLSKHLKDCDYILIDHACETMTDALYKEGINIYHIAPFLRKTDIAIKNFLLGVSIASTLQHIHFKA